MNAWGWYASQDSPAHPRAGDVRAPRETSRITPHQQEPPAPQHWLCRQHMHGGYRRDVPGRC